jgi:hypothetical protein
LRKTFWKYFRWAILAGVIIASSVAAYMWFMPHRNVQASAAFATLKTIDLVAEFSTNSTKANAKYLSSDGNSKILILEGRVASITANQNHEKVILLKDEKAKAGVSCTFTQESASALKAVQKGDIIKVKGAITAGNKYDPDLDLTEHAILIQCSLIK